MIWKLDITKLRKLEYLQAGSEFQRHIFAVCRNILVFL